MSVFIIAEAGSNWYAGEDDTEQNRLSRAVALTDIAADAGADAIKWQVYTANSLYREGTEYWNVVRPLEMPLRWLPILAGYARERRVEFMASAFSPELYDAIDPFVQRHKVASLEITDHALLRHIAEKGKPVLFSIGAATWAEAEAANSILTEEVDTTVLHCVTAYPCPPDEANISVIRDRGQWGWNMGLSDHTQDPVVAPVLAVAYGASVVEKHFTLGRALRGPDHHYALEPDELKAMVRAVRLAERMVGTGTKHIQPSEAQWRKWQHKSGSVRGS